MKAVVQRVNRASVCVDGQMVNEIGSGLLVFAGLGADDSERDMEFTAGKIARLRIFPGNGKESELSVKDIGGEILLVSQFTLYGDVNKGNRPSFSEAMPADTARETFPKFAAILRKQDVTVKEGVFQAMMKVRLENDGPYTIIIDSKQNR